MDRTRIEAASEALVEAYDDLDPTDAKYVEKLKAIATVHQQVVGDSQLGLTKEIEAERARVEETRIKTERRTNFVKNILTGAGIAASVAMGIYNTVHLDRRFEKSAAKEADDAYLTLTEKTTVQDSLRDEEKHKTNRFFTW